MPSSSTHPVTIAGRALPPPRHVCCFFDSRDQQYAVILPYIAEGLANQERVMAVMDGELIGDHERRLSAGGIDVEAARRSGHLAALRTDETYLVDGRFAKRRMYQVLEHALMETEANGYTRLRTCGDMAWAQRSMAGSDELLDYESEVNTLLEHHDATFMCVYDTSRMSGREMLDVLATHSQVLVGTRMLGNPHYLPPEEYRRSFVARRVAGEKA